MRTPTTRLSPLLISLLILVAAFVPAPEIRGSELLTVVEQLHDLPIEHPWDIAISSDDRHIYMLGDDALAVFERNGRSGQARLIEAHIEGRGDVRGLHFANALTLSDDGRYLYTGSPRYTGPDGVDRPGVAIFEREPADGSLRLAQVHTEGFENLRSGSVHAVLSPDNAHLYVISAADEAVLTFERDRADGGLHFLGATRQALAGGFGAFDPTGSHLYVTNRRRSSLVAYERDPESGLLRQLQSLRSGNPDYERIFPVNPGSVMVSPDGKHVYVTNVSAFPFDGGDGMIVAFRRNKSGTLTLLQAGDLQAFPNRMVFSPDGSTIYAPGQGNDICPLSEVNVYHRDSRTGALGLQQTVFEDQERFHQSTWTHAIAISHDGRHVYTGGFNGRTLAVFARRAAQGRLVPRVDPNDPSAGLGQLRGAERGAVSPDGRHLYVANPATSTLSVFERREGGGLRFVEVLTELGSTTETVAVGPNGRFVYAFEGVFRRRAGSGRLTRVEQADLAFISFNADDIAPSPDGRHVYLTSRGYDGPIQAYRQGRAEGRLAKLDLTLPPVTRLGALKRSHAVTVSPDGAFVYALGIFERTRDCCDDVSAVWVFRRRAATGLLELIHYDVLGLRDLYGREGRLSLSPDGRHLYVVRPTEDRLLVYEHDRENRRLVEVEEHLHDEFSAVGLDDPRDVQVSPSGQLVYVAARESHSVAIFERQPETGRLTFVEAITDRDAPGLFGVEGLALSPDGGSVYALSPRLSSVTTFARE